MTDNVIKELKEQLAASHAREKVLRDAAKEAIFALAVTWAEIVALRAGVNECYRMLISEPNTKIALDRAETMLRELMPPNAKFRPGMEAQPEGIAPGTQS